MRLLITGSRLWTDVDRLERVLSRFRGRYVTLVSGACPYGVDAMCEAYAALQEWQVETHPALWEEHGLGAGFLRNIEMAKLGADLCLAFPTICECAKYKVRHYSHGTAHMIRQAEKHGIAVRVYEDKLSA